MDNRVLNGALICFAILAILFYLEKIKNDEREVSIRELIKDSISNIKDEFTSMNVRIKKELDKTSEKLISLDSNIREELNAHTKNTDVYLKKLEYEQRLEIRKIETEYEERMTNIEERFNQKVVVLSNILNQIIDDNNELRKKLSFFTEIEKDSQELNEKENTDKREELIRIALEELGGKIKIQNSGSPIATNTKMNTIEKTDTSKDVCAHTNVLDEEQQAAFDLMNNSDNNLFITGKAGTGKSFLLDVFVRGTEKKTLKLAPTGIAALNIGGATLHSALGYYNLEQLSVEDINGKNIRLKSDKIRILKEIDTLIIDEISMVRSDIFEKIDKLLQVVNRNSKPFGGKQMVIFGDLFQLPPVVKWHESKYLQEQYGGIYFFNSHAYKNANFGFIELTKNHRQKEDVQFFEILNRIRTGDITSDDISCLNQKIVTNKDELRRVTTLFPKKADAERVNEEELAKIEAKQYTYKARILYNATNNQNPNLDAAFPITDELKLKRGALVMMVANDPGKKWVNGTMGVIKSLTETSIHVTIDGLTYEVLPAEFTEQEAVYEDGHIKYNDVLTVEQFPVVLAYAITIHKSQGMTYKKIACDISKCFASGQTYVALSRCSSLNGLHLLSPITHSILKIEDSVYNFYMELSNGNANYN